MNREDSSVPAAGMPALCWPLEGSPGWKKLDQMKCDGGILLEAF